MIVRTPSFSLLASAATAGAALAQASGTITAYTSQPIEQMDAVVAAFSEDHPEIEVEVFRTGTTKLVAKLQAEFAAGETPTDVMLIADAVAMTQLKNDGRLLAYPEAPVEGLPEAVVDPDMTFFGTKLITTGIVYNTDLVDTPPTSWSELAAPDVASSLIMPSPLYSGSAVIHGQHHGPAARVRLGLIRDTGGERRRRWPRQRHHDRGRGAGREGLRHHLRIHGAQRAGRGIARGLRVPQEGVSSITQPVAILSDSDNVEAAKVFVDWQLGQAAQEQSVEQVYFPILEGVAQPEGYPDPASLTILSADLAVMLADHAANKQQFAGLLGG